MRKLLFLLLVGVIAGVAWMNRDQITALLGRHSPTGEAASLEVAQQAEKKLQDLANGEADSVKLSSVEIQSLLNYRFVQVLPAFVDSPRIELEDGKIKVNARIPVDQLPEIGGLGDAAAFLPDTTDVGMTGRILPLGSGRIAIAIDEVNAASIPLPNRLVPPALRKLGRRNEPGLPQNALAVPLPPGAGSARVSGDTLVITRLANHTGQD